MLFHGISGGHIQGIMEEMERRSKTEARLAKGTQLNGRDAVRNGPGVALEKLRVSGLPRLGIAGPGDICLGMLTRFSREVCLLGKGPFPIRGVWDAAVLNSPVFVAADHDRAGQLALEGAGVLPCQHQTPVSGDSAARPDRPPRGQALVQAGTKGPGQAGALGPPVSGMQDQTFRVDPEALVGFQFFERSELNTRI
ncbi:hypothetical protein STEG23_033930 [Scotinomys teguina]